MKKKTNVHKMKTTIRIRIYGLVVIFLRNHHHRYSTNETVMYEDDQRLLLPRAYDILDLNEHELMSNMLHNNIVNRSRLHRRTEQIFRHNVHLHIHRITDHREHTV